MSRLVPLDIEFVGQLQARSLKGSAANWELICVHLPRVCSKLAFDICGNLWLASASLCRCAAAALQHEFIRQNAVQWEKTEASSKIWAMSEQQTVLVGFQVIVCARCVFSAFKSVL